MGGGPANTNTTDSEEFSDYCIVSEASTVRLLYSKSKVYVYRSTDKKDRIPGFISVVQGPDDQYYIAWTPEALLSDSDRESYVQIELCPNFSSSNTKEDEGVVSTSMEADDSCVLVSTEPLSHAGSISAIANYAFCKPVGEVSSLLIHPPSLTQWYGSVIINLVDGSSLAPLWFHDDESASTLLGMTRHWGGDELLVWLARAVNIERSKDDPNRYEFRQSKSQHITLSASPTPTSSTILTKPVAEPVTSMVDSASSVVDKAMGGDFDPLLSQASGLRWNILERFSRITKTVKDAATSFMEDTSVGRQVASYVPPSIPGGRKQTASSSLIKEYESARIYLAKWAAQHIIDQQNEEGEKESRIAADGNDQDGQQQHTSIWEEWVTENGDLGEFEVLATNKTANLPQPIRTRPALSAEKWLEFFEPSTSSSKSSDFKLMVDDDTVRRAVFAGGIEEDIRPVVWKYLLDIYPWDCTEQDRKDIDKQKYEEYWILKDKWLNDSKLKETDDFIEQNSRIEKDVLRTDRTLPLFATDSVYAGGDDETNVTEHGLPGSSASLEKMKDILMTFHYFDKTTMGYVQGMSDLLAPIYSVYQDEPTTFWAFSSFMRRMCSHFLRDQSGMQSELSTMAELVEIANPQLFSHLEKCDASNMFGCYRWLLIWFKREFSFEDILRLWEVLWSDYLTDRFVLFVALAILQRHADVMMDHLRTPEEVLKYLQDLSETINLNDALKGAEMSFYKVRHRVQVVEKARHDRGLPLFTVDEKDDDDDPEVVQLISFEYDDESTSKSKGKEPETAVTPSTTSSLASLPNLPMVSESVHRIFAKIYKKP